MVKRSTHVPVKVCLCVTSPSPCHSKTSSKFYIVQMVTDTLTGKLGCTPFLTMKVSVKKIGAVHKNGDGDDSNPKFNLYLMKINLPSLYLSNRKLPADVFFTHKIAISQNCMG